MTYLEFYSQLGSSEEIISSIFKKPKFPAYTFQSPPDLCYGFPPALIPLFSNGEWPGYIGIVKHWFGGGDDTFVEFFVEDHEIVEIAKNLDQFKIWMTFSFLSDIPDIEEVEDFSESISFYKRDELEEFFSECQNMHDLIRLDVFKSVTPQFFANDNGSPKWLFPSFTLNDIFKLISDKKYEQAWYALNSSSFSKEETISVLELLSSFVTDRNGFCDLIDLWSAHN